MNSTEQIIIFDRKDVQMFAQLIGDSNPIYKDIKSAKEYGFTTIPLPPTMPMIAYKWVKTPWQFQAPLIHRKQQGISYESMYIDVPYSAIVNLHVASKRKKFMLIEQTMLLYNDEDVLCFKGISNLIAGGMK